MSKKYVDNRYVPNKYGELKEIRYRERSNLSNIYQKIINYIQNECLNIFYPRDTMHLVRRLTGYIGTYGGYSSAERFFSIDGKEINARIERTKSSWQEIINKIIYNIYILDDCLVDSEYILEDIFNEYLKVETSSSISENEFVKKFDYNSLIKYIQEVFNENYSNIEILLRKLISDKNFFDYYYKNVTDEDYFDLLLKHKEIFFKFKPKWISVEDVNLFMELQ